MTGPDMCNNMSTFYEYPYQVTICFKCVNVNDVYISILWAPIPNVPMFLPLCKLNEKCYVDSIGTDTSSHMYYSSLLCELYCVVM